MKWYQTNIDAPSSGDYARVYVLLTEEKRKRIDRFRFEDDKRRSLAGEKLARRAVAAWCGVPEETVAFDSGPNGKPFARGLAAEFSVSHSDALVVCAVDDAPIGIDVERVRPIDLAIARRVCTEEELAHLFGRAPLPSDFTRTGDPALLDRFFTLWTRKEAAAKRSGAGLAQIQCPCPETGVQTFREGEYVISICQTPK